MEKLLLVLQALLVVSIGIIIHMYTRSLPDCPTIDLDEKVGNSHNDDSIMASIIESGSSVHCWGNNESVRMCRFKNLCFLPSAGEFVFFHGDKSVYSGLPDDRHSPTLVEMSSVKQHNVHYFNYIDIEAAASINLLSRARIINQTSLLFNRFHPENLMHVFHDDLIPLHHTLRSLYLYDGDGKSFTTLVALDTASWGPFWELYSLITDGEVLTRQGLEQQDEPTCFQDAYVGIKKDTVWYQYGFQVPQGPVSASASQSHQLSSFVNHFREKLDIDTIDNEPSNLAVILSRKSTRLILNELELALDIANQASMKVQIISIETHSIKELISAISKASILIAMHGSLLTLLMFLPPRAMVLELYPYAVDPDDYTPYKTLATRLGMTYHCWRNVNESNTVTHPDRPPELGGISHLPHERQEFIRRSKLVLSHLCCTNPEWMFRAFQDTVVNTSDVIALITNFNEKSPEDHMGDISSRQTLVRPSHVRGIVCMEGDAPSSLRISWTPSFNLPYIRHARVQYEVWIQEDGELDYTAWIISTTSHLFQSNLKENTAYNIWVRCIIDEALIGPFNAENIKCVSK